MSDGGLGPRMNRRTLLAAMSTVGTVGALTGRGAAAYLADRETLGPNEVTAGAVTLSLDGTDTGRASVGFTVDAYGYTNRDERTICLGLGAESNPGWVWVRSCPRYPSVEDDLSARVTVDGAIAFSGTFGDLLAELSGGDGGGVLLTAFAAGEEAPLSPGPDGTVCLTVAVWAPTGLRDDPDAVRALRAASPLAFTLDVYAEQSRHVPTPRRPGDGVNPSFAFPACAEPGDPPAVTDLGHGISNVSLCTGTPADPGAITWTVRDPETDADVTGVPGEASVLELTSPVPITDVVVKAGAEHRRFDAGGATTVTVDSTGGTPLDVPGNFSKCACEGAGVKLDDWSDAAGTFTALETLSCGSTGSQSSGPATPDVDDEATEPAGSPAGSPARDDRGRVPPTGDTE